MATNMTDNDRKILAAVRKRDADGVSALLDEHRLGPMRRLAHLVEDDAHGASSG